MPLRPLLILILALPSMAQPPSAAPRTPAERLVRLLRLLQTDHEQLDALKQEQSDLEERFTAAQAEFLALDERLAGSQTDPSVTQSWTRSRDRLNLILDRRKAVQQELATLADKIAFEEEFRSQFSSTASPPIARDQRDATKPDQAARPPAGPPPAAAITPAPNSPKPRPETADLDPRLVEARQESQAKQAALQSARTRLEHLQRGIEIFRRDLASSRALLETGQKALAADQEQIRALDAAESPDGSQSSGVQREQAERDLEARRAQVIRQTERIADSELTLASLEAAQANAIKRVQDADADAQVAARRVAFLESPVAPHQMWVWIMSRGPRVLATLAAAAVALVLARIVGRQVIGRIIRRARRSHPDHAGRGETLQRVFVSTATVAAVVLGTLAALNQAGIDVTVLLGSAAVIGAAVAFGSQNLIRDFFSGFMILVENQYSVGNVVRIGDTTGTVEDISLRMTALRDLEGVVHFIPHSQVASVSNLTYGWSRIVLDVRVSSAEDPDRVMRELLAVARGLKADPQFGTQIVADPEMLGVDAVLGPAMTIKLLVKTRPLSSWPVKRELLRRIKRRFDELGIKFA